MKKLFIFINSTILLIFLLCFNIFTPISATEQTEEYIEQTESQQINKEFLGTYQITFYCPCSNCCGWSGGTAASGTTPTANYTCACGQDIPFGTEIYIEGLGTFVCEDRGVSSGWIDVFVNSHQQALQLGLQYLNCYKIVGGDNE